MDTNTASTMVGEHPPHGPVPHDTSSSQNPAHIQSPSDLLMDAPNYSSEKVRIQPRRMQESGKRNQRSTSTCCHANPTDDQDNRSRYMTRSWTLARPEPKPRTDAASAKPKTRAEVAKCRDRDAHVTFFHTSPQPPFALSACADPQLGPRYLYDRGCGVCWLDAWHEFIHTLIR